MNSKTIKVFSIAIVSFCILFGFSADAQASTASSSSACIKATVNDHNDKFDRGTIGVRASEVVIANDCSEDVIISSLGFLGKFGSDTLNGARLYIDGKSAGSFSQVTATSAKYTGLSLKIAKGKSTKIMLVGDISTDPSAHSLTYRFDDCPSAFVLKDARTGKVIAASASGSSNICISDKIKAYANTKTQSIKATVVNNTQKAEKGNRLNVMELKLTNTGSEELIVSGMGFLGTFENKGVMDANLWVEEVSMGSLVTKSYGIRYQGMNIRIAPGKSARVVLRGTISENVTANTLKYRFDSCPNVFQVKGAVSGKKAKIAVNGNSILKIAK